MFSVALLLFLQRFSRPFLVWLPALSRLSLAAYPVMLLV
jgi:hypothetical protein